MVTLTITLRMRKHHPLESWSWSTDQWPLGPASTGAHMSAARLRSLQAFANGQVFLAMERLRLLAVHDAALGTWKNAPQHEAAKIHVRAPATPLVMLFTCGAEPTLLGKARARTKSGGAAYADGGLCPDNRIGGARPT